MSGRAVVSPYKMHSSKDSECRQVGQRESVRGNAAVTSKARATRSSSVNRGARRVNVSRSIGSYHPQAIFLTVELTVKMIR